MLFLIAGLLCSAMVSIVLKASSRWEYDRYLMLAINYMACLIPFIISRIGQPSPAINKDFGLCIIFAAINGFLYLAGMVMNQVNVRRNGAILQSTFSRLGVMVPTCLSIIFFGERPSAKEAIGIIIVLVAFCIMNIPQEKTEIGTYDDLLGKEVILWGDPETGELDITAFYKAKIVGIVKTPKEEELDLVRAGSYARRFAETVVYWEGWRDVFFADGDPLCHEMVAPPVETLQEARACVEVSERMIDSYFERFPVTGINDVPQSVGVNGLPTFSSMFGEEMWYPMWYTQETGAVFIMLVAAAVFLVVSLLLCWHVTTASLKQKEREIGILRSAGASSAEVKKLVLTETLFLCCCIFLVSLILTLAGYYGFLVAPYAPWYPWQTGTFAHATEFVFNGWTVLILAGLSFGVPLLCSIVPLRKFLKKSIVDNISGNIKAR